MCFWVGRLSIKKRGISSSVIHLPSDRLQAGNYITWIEDSGNAANFRRVELKMSAHFLALYLFEKY